jgi:ketose-bisphosphate aldolase
MMKKGTANMADKAENINDILRRAAAGGYAVGAFSARYTRFIRPILEAAIHTDSPVIVQLSEIELNRHKVDINNFAEVFVREMSMLKPDVPVVLHLDHTKSLSVIQAAMDAGFTSVMIDASTKKFDENAAATRQVVEMAHPRGVSVEGELGRISTTRPEDMEEDEKHYTDPQEAKKFCGLTGVDCLAVSVGTAHGSYTVKQPKIDYDRLREINRVVSVPLVLHGGSGVPSEMVVRAVQMKEGGVSKVNVATDLELAMMAVVGREGHMTEAEFNSFPEELILRSLDAVRSLVELKMTQYVLSAGKARAFRK